jgi:serine/threonine protein kinase
VGSLELTATGALLGTPPYMAPEQWCGAGVAAATDQFAYCVALWEALAGERPFRGPTLDDFRRQAAHGPATLDASRIPRWARGLLLRGMDPDPARRWPSMDALLARLAAAPASWRSRSAFARYHDSRPRCVCPASSSRASRWSRR